MALGLALASFGLAGMGVSVLSAGSFALLVGLFSGLVVCLAVLVFVRVEA